jgi:predicted DNA-binding transcriptional regulator YafY
MARCDQSTRQLLLISKLENARRGLTLRELAESLPDDWARHPRTIRRDLEALELHFPVYTDRKGGQTRWKLIEGFRSITQLGFSPTELMALVFSRDLLRPLDGTPMKTLLDAAVSKAEAALPPEAMEHVGRMRDYFAVGLGPHKNYRLHREVIDQLSRAIEESRTVQMRYYSASRNVTTRRDVDPYRLWYASGSLYLVAFCHLRDDVRMFAVDRIRSLKTTTHPCQMPLGFDIEAYVQDALVVMRGSQIEVELLFDEKTSAWVKDRQWHSSQKIEQLTGGRIRMALRVADTRELLGWILSFGSAVQVVRPAALRSKVREEAEKILALGTPDVTDGT